MGIVTRTGATIILVPKYGNGVGGVVVDIRQDNLCLLSV